MHFIMGFTFLLCGNELNSINIRAAVGRRDGVIECIAVAASMLGAMSISTADKTWTVRISDSMCGAKHNTSAEHGKKMSDRDCTLACVKDHNAKYVFASGGKVYNVGNQDFGALQFGRIDSPSTRRVGFIVEGFAEMIRGTILVL